MTLFRFLGLWILAGGAEFPLMLNVTGGGDYPAAVAWGGHVLAAILVSLGVVRRKGLASFSQRWTWWLFLWTLLLPGAGWLFGGTLVMAGWNAHEPQKAVDEKDELAASFSTDPPKPVETAPVRIVKELDFVSLVEILAGDDINLKRGAIEQLTRLRTPEAIAVLMSHRSDPSMEMRYYVNSSLTRIKKEFDEALDAARHQMRMDVDNVADRLGLAKIYMEYAGSGLLEPDLVISYENEAVLHLNYVLDSRTPTRDAAEMLITHQIRVRDWSTAEASVQKARDLGLITDVAAAEYLAEISYSQGRFGKIANVLRPFFADPSLSADWKTALLWWGVET